MIGSNFDLNFSARQGIGRSFLTFCGSTFSALQMQLQKPKKVAEHVVAGAEKDVVRCTNRCVFSVSLFVSSLFQDKHYFGDEFQHFKKDVLAVLIG